MNSIGEKLAIIRGDIQQFSPWPERVRIVAVTKRFSVSEMRMAAAAGITDFGENRIQEALNKFSSETFPGIERHYIGAFQSNKAQDILNHFDWLHSLDRLKTARLVAKEESSLHILIQVNTSGETSKGGIAPDDMESFVDQLIESTPSLLIKGLMTMGPLTKDTKKNRHSFALLRELSEKMKDRETGSFSFHELSMGMTDDYRIALEEGATMIRIGRGLFGPRPEGVQPI